MNRTMRVICIIFILCLYAAYLVNIGSGSPLNMKDDFNGEMPTTKNMNPDRIGDKFEETSSNKDQRSGAFNSHNFHYKKRKRSIYISRFRHNPFIDFPKGYWENRSVSKMLALLEKHRNRDGLPYIIPFEVFELPDLAEIDGHIVKIIPLPKENVTRTVVNETGVNSDRNARVQIEIAQHEYAENGTKRLKNNLHPNKDINAGVIKPSYEYDDGRRDAEYDDGNPDAGCDGDHRDAGYDGDHRDAGYNGHPDAEYDDGHPDAEYDDGHPDAEYDDGHPDAEYDDGNPDAGYDDGHPDAEYDDGHPDAGYDDGHPDAGYDDGHPDAEYDDGHPDAEYDDGHPDAEYDDGHPDAEYDDGHPDAGYDDGHPDAGYDDGHPDAEYDDGNPDAGYRDGHRDAVYDDRHLNDEYSNDYSGTSVDIDPRKFSRELLKPVDLKEDNSGKETMPDIVKRKGDIGKTHIQTLEDSVEKNKTGRLIEIFTRANSTFECTTPKNESGRCRTFSECPIRSIVNNYSLFLEYMCLRGVFVGICCSDNPVVEISDSNEENSTESVTKDIQQPPEGCGLRHSTRIVGGTVSVPHEWSWMVALTRRDRFFCGGVIINNWYILTAAHCVLGVQVRDLKVRLGEYNFFEKNEHQQDIPVAEIKRHALFVTLTFQHDIALLKLKRRIEYSKFIGSICLPEPVGRNYSDEKATVVGWGTVSFGGAASPVLRQVTIPVWENEDCDRSYFLENINDSFLCAGSLENGEDACQGDSGGPLMTLSSQNRWEVIGIVSWGRRCGDPTYPGVYTRVTSYLDWIAEHAK